MSIRIPLIAGVVLLFLALLATGATLNLRWPPSVFSEEEAAASAPPLPLSARIPAGQVATAVRLGGVEGVGGAIRPGDTIDLYAFWSGRVTGEGAETRVLLRQKLVYAMSQSTDAMSITLAVSPEEAALLQDTLRAGARPYAMLRSARGMGAPEAPAEFDDASVAPWVATIGESR